MLYLTIVSILWSFSFGIIKFGLTGVDSIFISFFRSLIAFIFFSSLTLYNIKKFSFDTKLIIIGAIQFGLMYVFYIQSYQYLPAYLIATFTITTPIFVGLFSQALMKESFSKNGILSIILVLIGSFMMRFNFANPLDYWLGFILIQCANMFFASGQIMFKKWYTENSDKDIVHNFSQMFFGATIVTSLFYFQTMDVQNILSTTNLLSLIFLGLCSTGMGFLLWNIGATKVSNTRLAVMNNVVIPLAVLNSFFIFREDINILLFMPGLICFYAAYRLSS
tara:strand:+ start:11758 stop:12591 length:834 start_codon:yes stop_codon:yes gene_type:complete